MASRVMTRRESSKAEQLKNSKEKKSTDMNRLFQKNNTSKKNNKVDPSLHLLNSADANILPVDNEAIEKISAEELMNAIDRLAAVVKTVSEGLKTTSEQICKQRSTPKLGIKKEQIVSEQDFPLLEKFETFKLPIQSIILNVWNPI